MSDKLSERPSEGFVLRLRNDGSRLRPWWGTITHGVFHVGEAGSTIYRSGSRAVCVRRMMRTVASIAARQSLPRIEVRIEGEQDE